jgi:hypothetical protein
MSRALLLLIISLALVACQGTNQKAPLSHTLGTGTGGANANGDATPKDATLKALLAKNASCFPLAAIVAHYETNDDTFAVYVKSRDLLTGVTDDNPAGTPYDDKKARAAVLIKGLTTPLIDLPSGGALASSKVAGNLIDVAAPADDKCESFSFSGASPNTPDVFTVKKPTTAPAKDAAPTLILVGKNVTRFYKMNGDNLEVIVSTPLDPVQASVGKSPALTLRTKYLIVPDIGDNLKLGLGWADLLDSTVTTSPEFSNAVNAAKNKSQPQPQLQVTTAPKPPSNPRVQQPAAKPMVSKVPAQEVSVSVVSYINISTEMQNGQATKSPPASQPDGD